MFIWAESRVRARNRPIHITYLGCYLGVYGCRLFFFINLNVLGFDLNVLGFDLVVLGFDLNVLGLKKRVLGLKKGFWVLKNGFWVFLQVVVLRDFL